MKTLSRHIQLKVLINLGATHEVDNSSSEEEFECTTRNQSEIVQFNDSSDGKGGKIVQVVVLFICLWQSVFKISDAAVEILLKFLSSLVKVLAGSPSILLSLASLIPSSIYLLRKNSRHENCEKFIEFVVCPSCYSLYKMEDCLEIVGGEKIPKQCRQIKYPNHPVSAYRKACNTPLFKKIRLFNGRVEFRPRFVYAYQPLKITLQQLLNRPGFADKLEWWRNRTTSEGKLSDI